LLAIGVIGSSSYQTVAERQLRPGEAMEVGAYTLTYRSLERRQARNAREVRAVLDVERGGQPLGVLEAGKNSYPLEQEVSNEVGIRSDMRTGEDLFVIAEQIDPDGAVWFTVFVKPLVNLIWLAGLVFIGGSLIAMWPDAREQRRLALRYEGAGARAEA
jgi:cytochrome c-type biogenesis protein CcmF